MATRPDRPGATAWLPDPDHRDVAHLREAATACRGCELWEPATQVVFSAGVVTGRVALVGEQPGDVEDQRGIPFVGPAGRLLQEAVAEAGLAREDVYVTNAVKHFRFSQSAPGNRRIHATPDAGHVTACKPWLAAELVAVDPDVVVVLGATAAKALLGPSFRVTRERGVVLERETSRGTKRFVATIHPSAVLRTPAPEREQARAGLVADLRVAASALGDGAAET
ncbi:UdgX family uracil-DNA binding protein [Pseudokineococcus sp. 1T1Z-3]|uniref:UdgX family uracil-DNA binding protein n=1 Tax=Pseudokineococcus sp. 1T1Z-3 TaxID=3132745 RepID=UPI0030A962A0